MQPSLLKIKILFTYQMGKRHKNGCHSHFSYQYYSKAVMKVLTILKQTDN